LKELVHFYFIYKEKCIAIHRKTGMTFGKLAQMANEMGEDSLADVFYKRSESWRNIINPETGFGTPRLNGDWLPNFDPKEVNLHFTEANSWQYSFVQQEAGMMGSSKDLEKRLDALFSEKEQTTGRTQSDITGLIGQYAHGNEPSHHIAYLYNYTDHPEKGQKIIKHICDSFYTNAPDGLIGNEDCGQMSAWYVLSTSGFYPIAPSEGQYCSGLCLFDSVKYNLTNSSSFVIESDQYIGGKFYVLDTLRVENKVISDCSTSWPSGFSNYAISKGVNFTFSKYSFCSNVHNVSDKNPSAKSFVPLISGKYLFSDSTLISLKGIDSMSKIYYSSENSPSSFIRYSKPFTIRSNSKVYAYAESLISKGLSIGDAKIMEDEGLVFSIKDSFSKSPTISATFYKKPNNWTCTPSIPPNTQYTGGGDDALIDGINGTTNWQAGRWQGFQNKEVEFIIDLKEERKISEVSLNFLQDARSWILLPKDVSVYVNGKLVATDILNVDALREGNFTQMVKLKIPKCKSQMVKIVVHSAGPIEHAPLKLYSSKSKKKSNHVMTGFFIEDLTCFLD